MNAEQKFDRRGFLKLGGGVAVSAALARLGLAEATGTPEDLPAHITYFEAGAVWFNKATQANVTLQRKGDILLLMSQKTKVMGVDWDVDPTNHPERTQVIAIANEGNSPVTFMYETFDGIFTRQDRERTSRTDRESLIEDVTTASLVQVSRSRIPGNCVATGCAATRVVTALAFEQNGKPQFERLEDRIDTR